jgi:type III pantothenate kinase
MDEAAQGAATPQQARTLLVDLGNSRVKWAWLAGGVVGGHGSRAWSDVSRAMVPGAEHPARVLYVPMTRSTGNRLLERAVFRWWRLAAEPCPAEARRDGLANGYAEPARLGADRWAAMLAAWRRVRGAVCVVDAGTALTIDCIDENGRHQAGYLHPGVAAVTRALRASTGVRPGAPPRPAAPAAGGGTEPALAHGGLDTARCLEAALGLAQVGLVEGVWRRCQRAWPQARLLLTGGDAERLAGQLAGLPLEVLPHLVLEGLAARAGTP